MLPPSILPLEPLDARLEGDVNTDTDVAAVVFFCLLLELVSLPVRKNPKP